MYEKLIVLIGLRCGFETFQAWCRAFGQSNYQRGLIPKAVSLYDFCSALREVLLKKQAFASKLAQIAVFCSL